MANTSNFGTSGTLGVNFAQTFSPPGSSVYSTGDQPPFQLGAQSQGTDGSAWIYVQLGTGGITGTGYVCVYDEDFQAVMLSTSNDVTGDKLGVPGCGVAIEDDYCWLQVYGSCAEIQVAASTAANVALAATATGGQLDDGVTTGPYAQGIVLTTARTSSDGTAPGVLNWPTIQPYDTPA